jgi:hypothetical protein
MSGIVANCRTRSPALLELGRTGALSPGSSSGSW